MNEYDLSGKVAIITGGAQGIGLSIARLMSKSGARVVICDVDYALAKEVVNSLSQQSLAEELDVTDSNQVKATIAKITKALGKIDILVNSAGIAGPNSPVVDYAVKDWNEIIAINLNGTFNMCKYVLPSMISNKYGRIVNISSIAGKEGNPNAAAYSASKAGVIALTKSLGKEHASQNITINCITPAAAKTRIFDQMSKDHINFMLSKIPRGRFLDVTEVASMVAWLCTEENSFSTGAVFDISGGRATY